MFLYIFQNHGGITVSLYALCFEKWQFVQSLTLLQKQNI